MDLTPATQRFVLHWGEMGSRWGVNRTVAQIHALLYITGRPMPADELAETLGVARSNVSTSLKELQNWNLISIVHVMGDRRDHFQTLTDIWELFRTIVRERKEREFDPTIALLRELTAAPTFAREDAATRARIQETLEFMEALGSWAEEMLRLSPEALTGAVKLGAKFQKLLRRDRKAGASA